MKKETMQFWGAFWGVVLGFIITKIYQIWSMLFLTEGLKYAGINRWEGTPLWILATENPIAFLIMMEVIFGVIGYFFAKTSFGDGK